MCTVVGSLHKLYINNYDFVANLNFMSAFIYIHSIYSKPLYFPIKNAVYAKCILLEQLNPAFEMLIFVNSIIY
jgi:hypothetical protein